MVTCGIASQNRYTGIKFFSVTKAIVRLLTILTELCKKKKDFF